uniref:Nucleoporin seh1-like n=1 Tax=Sinocyclocheilus anshuiensis TaxID=1608454 RepID=A0A671SE14_9TELE
MFVARSIAADHKDLIHDVSYDFHGRRMATCSSDQSMKVWDKGGNAEWNCTASWKVGLTIKQWFSTRSPGPTRGHQQTSKGTHSGSVWRVTWAHPEFGQVLASCSFDRTAIVWEEIVGESNDKQRGQSHWIKRTTLVDSRTSVTDVKFAPKHMGLMLTTCSADGVVRIYEAPDVMNLSQWSLQHEISSKLSCSCISWNPSSSRAHAPMIAVGSDDSNVTYGGKVQIYEYNEVTRKYAKAETLMTVTDAVHDIAFAPNLGRSFHVLAIATKDVRIFKLVPLRKDSSSSAPTKFEVQVLAQFDSHNSQVWRVSWNITSTLLASSGDDGCVRLWKANYMDNWKCTGILKGDGSPVSGQPGALSGILGSATAQSALNGATRR